MPIAPRLTSSLNENEKDYLFDLQGFLVLDQALNPDQLSAIDAWIDRQPDDLSNGDWLDQVQVHSYGVNDGCNFQNIIEGGDVFEQLMDSPIWFDMVRRYMENDYNQISIVENFLNIRPPGGFLELHSGGQLCSPIHTFRHHNGNWNVGQINILMALTDIGPGDGPTIVVPGSHKSDELHPFFHRSEKITYDTTKSIPNEALGAIEVHLKRGQALMFSDAITHAGSERTNPGDRKVMIYRYSPHHVIPRYNYVSSPEFLDRLTPQRRQLVENCPPPRLRPDRALAGRQTP
jgi:hypothetical protein